MTEDYLELRKKVDDINRRSKIFTMAYDPYVAKARPQALYKLADTLEASGCVSEESTANGKVRIEITVLKPIKPGTVPPPRKDQ